MTTARSASRWMFTTASPVTSVAASAVPETVFVARLSSAVDGSTVATIVTVTVWFGAIVPKVHVMSPPASEPSWAHVPSGETAETNDTSAGSVSTICALSASEGPSFRNVTV